MNITVEESMCIGAGNCVGAAPQLFAQDDKTGIVIVLQDQADASQVDDAQLAADVCPVAAIALAN